MNFENAYNRLKEINAILQSGQLLDIQKIIELQKEAKELYEFCNKTIIKSEMTVNSDK